ncbi:MAG: hypothetical protein KDB94_00825 [Acidobacteria bacterium]|nr:hypothetical protein [Acidobacteriota bacterium]MCB9377282.1 hypothetical protein [Holophagales bacterium]
MTDRSPRPSVATAVALLLAAVLASSLPAAERSISVSYVSSSSVYLDAGRADGLDLADRLRVVRRGETVALLEVDFVAEHSASCRVLEAHGEVRSGDRVILTASPESENAPSVEAALAPTPEPAPIPVVIQTDDPTSYYRRPRTRVSGVVSLGFRSFDPGFGRSSTENQGRLSLRLRDIGGRPWSLRVRGRAREIRRDGYGASVATSQRSDRLYELSLAYDPPEGRFAFRFGRLSTGGFSSLGYLDGALGEIRLGRLFAIGAFGGLRPDLTEIDLGSAGEKYGAYVRFATRREGDAPYAEVVVGGASERSKGGEISRDFVTLESRFGAGSRWWIFQRAEIDLNRGWRREETGSSSQVTNAALSGSLRLSRSLRATLSYDQRRSYLTWENRPVLPEEVFTRLFREGGRLALEWQSRGWSASLGGGQERARDIDDPTASAFLSLLKGGAFGRPLLLGGDLSWYQGGVVEGYVASLRARWSFRAGHDVALTIGGSETSMVEATLGPSRSNQWVRLSGTLQLPFRIFLFGEYELSTGDDLDGSRATLEAGYRF